LKKNRIIVFWVRLIATVIAMIISAISDAQMLFSGSLDDALLRIKFAIVVNIVFVILLVWWIAESQWSLYEISLTRPILRFANCGSQEFNGDKTALDLSTHPFTDFTQETGFRIDTLWVDVVNARKNDIQGDALDVVAKIVIFDFTGKNKLQEYYGRWDNPIVLDEKGKVPYLKINNQNPFLVTDISSNGLPKRVRFAFKYRGDSHFLALDGSILHSRDWGNASEKFGAEIYVVEITLQGKNTEKTEGKFFIKNQTDKFPTDRPKLFITQEKGK
jgi:hypothetical protein